MVIYKVGGAVRDQLLGIEPQEIDWVVTGSTPEAMLAQGYKQVGKDFPVFLHPKTKEEYALARIEKKTNEGHRGFSCFSDPSVTLEEDLKRRDLTINAIAESQDGRLIDPYQGKVDLENKVLRHISDAFIEDPLRILRVARFAARLPSFEVAPETQKLLKSMVENRMLSELTPERVWKELERALSEPCPDRFFEVLQACGANEVLWPLFENQIDQLGKYARYSNDVETRFAILFYGQPVDVVRSFVEQWKISKKYQAIAIIVANGALYMSDASESQEKLVKFLEKVDVKRRIYLVPQWLDVVAFSTSKKQAKWLKEAIDLFVNVDEAAVVRTCKDPKDIGPSLFEARKRALTSLF